MTSKLGVVYAISWVALVVICGCGGGTNYTWEDPEKPDLMDSDSGLEELIPDPIVFWGQGFQALCRVGNNSATEAGAFTVKLYASTNTVITTSDYYLGQVNVAGLAAWEAQTLIFDVASFPSLTPNSYYIGYIIDTADTVDEEEEGNNTGLCTIGTLQVVAPPTELFSAVPVNDSVGYQQWKYYYIVVPALSENLEIATTNATGDVDLYVRHTIGLPDFVHADFVEDNSSGNETVFIDGTTSPPLPPWWESVWYIGVYGYAAASYTIMATIDGSSVDPESLVVSNGFRPHLSPDGTKIAFTRLSSWQADAQSDIWVVNIDGTGCQQITSTAGSSEFSPQWAPDGQTIAFVRKSGQYFSSAMGTLHEIDPDGSDEVERFSSALVQDFCFYVWSETTYVMLQYNDEGLWLGMSPWPTIGGLALRRAEGVHPRSQAAPAVTTPNISIFDPTLLGTRGAFVFDPINLDETEVVNAGRFPWPFLSPSGTKVAAGADGGISAGIYTMNTDGTGLVQLTTGPDYQPTWSQDTIVFVRIPGGGSLEHGDIYKLTGVVE
ncbi:MAG: PD40 domain-containing protein [Planctomycetes bacterium]|nr:PD40 domain-containing protein [Planctomycetota bacterium]